MSKSNVILNNMNLVLRNRELGCIKGCFMPKGIISKLTNYESRRLHEESDRLHNKCDKLFVQFDGAQVQKELLDDREERHHMGIPSLVQQLEDFACSSNPDDKSCVEILKGVISKLTNYESRRLHEESDQLHNNWAKLFVQFDGVQALVKMLLFTMSLPPGAYIKQETPTLLRCKALVLEILSLIITTKCGERVARQLCTQDELVQGLFLLLSYEKTFLCAAQLLEDLLQERSGVFDLSKIAGLQQLLASLDDAKLANCCRIFAITVSDMDVYENKSSLFEQNRQRRTKGFVNIRDVNQELLMGYPDLLHRLVTLACKHPLVPRTGSLPSELECWMDFIDTSVSEQIYDTSSSDDLVDFIGGISTQLRDSAPLTQQPSLKVSYDLLHRVDVVYVLGLFLVGKHRKKVQRKLADLRLIPGLSELFDQFIWRCQSKSSQRHRLRGHNTACECSPEVAMKIQFLRLVHSFCDHSEFKHLLLTKSELNEIKNINRFAGSLTVDSLDNVNRALMCRGRQGLLSKIVDVMKKEPIASTFRFWLARAVESYLRGSTLYCDQIFLLRRGLLQHVANNILEHEQRPKEILQSSFDLLGEVVKFNYDAFRTFDQVLDCKRKFQQFIDIIGKNLVDSNMFLRSLILTCKHFSIELVEHKEYAESGCPLLAFVADFHNQLEYLHKLIAGIHVTSLTQENVSCLNTTLVFLMFAKRRGHLARYLRALRDRPPIVCLTRSGEDTLTACQMMRNFRELLLFWQDHYLHKDKDCSALEKSSRIDFDYWKQTVATLVSNDPDTCVSLNYYIAPGELRTC